MTRKNITLTEVAHAAQVSPMTASRAINNRPGVSLETREHVLKVAADLGYVTNRAAQKLSGGRSHVIGVIATDLENQYTGSLIASMSEAAWQAGYETLIYSHVEREKRPSGSVVQLLRQISDGVIAILPLEFGYLGDLASINIPVITIDHVGERAEFLAITTDCYEGARTAMRHLIGLGHRRIAYIAGDERLASARDRHHAYIETISQYGLESDPSLVLPGDFTEIRGFEATVELLSLANPPTAIFAANDLSAFGAITAIRKAGLRVPEDISVIGFDDILFAAQFSPALTTIRQPLHQIGHSAVEALLELIAGVEPPKPPKPPKPLPTEIVIRSSTGPRR
jgi:LacI family transcriptional regulator